MQEVQSGWVTTDRNIVMKLRRLVQHFLLSFFVWGSLVCSGDYGEWLKSSQDILFRKVEEGYQTYLHAMTHHILWI